MQRARELNRAINEMIGDEDVQLVKWAAEGMRSSAFDAALLSDLEIGIGSFQNQLREVLPVVSLAEPPAPGSLQRVNEELRQHAKVAAVS